MRGPSEVRQSYDTPHYHDDPDVVAASMDADPQTYADDEAPPRRTFKYSTANMKHERNWSKWLKIIGMFVAAVAFVIFLSWLVNHLFFGDSSDNAPSQAFNPNSNFPYDKQDIDSACSRGRINGPNGTQPCADRCEPAFFACCDPFGEHEAYDWSTSNLDAPPAKYNLDEWEGGECSFDTETQGCISYSKCQVLSDQFDPAPSTLEVLCSKENIRRDPVACQDLCTPHRCCFSTGNDNCIADRFDVCLDFAPCQNLRMLTNSAVTLEPAPEDLDQLCFFGLPECEEICAKAAHCGDDTTDMLRQNFITCLTYAACTGQSTTNITIPKMYNRLPKPPIELKEECTKTNPQECENQCNMGAGCCYGKISNCFNKDPLGCTAWNQQCQILPAKNWWVVI